MKRTYLGVIATLGLMAATALAQTTANGTPITGKTIQQRKEVQQKRIGNGVKNGSLTPRETAHLEKKETRINREERRDRAANGGKLTAGQRQKINRRQNHVSKQIYKDKHNARRQ